MHIYVNLYFRFRTSSRKKALVIAINVEMNKKNSTKNRRLEEIYYPDLIYLYSNRRPRGLMDKASDFGSEDCEFESRRGRKEFFKFFFLFFQSQSKG